MVRILPNTKQHEAAAASKCRQQRAAMKRRITYSAPIPSLHLPPAHRVTSLRFRCAFDGFHKIAGEQGNKDSHDGQPGKRAPQPQHTLLLLLAAASLAFLDLCHVQALIISKCAANKQTNRLWQGGEIDVSCASCVSNSSMCRMHVYRFGSIQGLGMEKQEGIEYESRSVDDDR